MYDPRDSRSWLCNHLRCLGSFMNTRMEITTYSCTRCGHEHSGPPYSFAADYPDPYANMSHDQRDIRAVIGSDQCIIDGEQFYIRGCLELPIIGTEDIFLWGVWAKLNGEPFDEISAHWETEGREKQIGPYKGLLANSLSIYPETLNMKLQIDIRPVGERPLFTLQESAHPLSIEQVNGLIADRAQEYACLLLKMA